MQWNIGPADMDKEVKNVVDSGHLVAKTKHLNN